MAVTQEQEWVLIGCGLIAHADEILDSSEWEAVLGLIAAIDDGEEAERWRRLLVDSAAIEERFAELQPLAPEYHRRILERCWAMALVDGGDSEIEATVYERIARALGVDEALAVAWREGWTAAAQRRNELVVGLAAVFINLDGELDLGQAIHFDGLLRRLSLPFGRRVELAELLHRPPALGPLRIALAELAVEARIGVLRELLPQIRASVAGESARAALLALAEGVGVAAEVAADLAAPDGESDPLKL